MRGYVLDGGTAVITGAASGIGAALARGLAERGSHLVLLDRDGEGVAAVAESICATLPQLRIATYVVNNAGVALAGRFDQVDAAQFDAVMAVNFHAVVTMTRALLPVLTTHPGSHV